MIPCLSCYNLIVEQNLMFAVVATAERYPAIIRGRQTHVQLGEFGSWARGLLGKHGIEHQSDAWRDHSSTVSKLGSNAGLNLKTPSRISITVYRLIAFHMRPNNAL